MRAPVARNLLRAGCAAGVLVLLGAGAVAGSNAWVERATRGRAYARATAIPGPAVAIVPGSHVHEGKPSVRLRHRLDAALALYREGRVGAILVSGNDTPESPEATTMHSWLRARGVPEAHILIDREGVRTRETMNRAASLFDVRRAVVCTQEANMSRSLFLAAHAGIDAVGLALPSRGGESARYVATERLKTTLAFLETLVREPPANATADRAVVALR